MPCGQGDGGRAPIGWLLEPIAARETATEEHDAHGKQARCEQGQISPAHARKQIAKADHAHLRPFPAIVIRS
jgi:hypothetical protein